MAGPPKIADKAARSTVLIIGKGETMDAALRLALDRHGLNVVEEASGDPKAAVTTTAPDLVLLVGDAARDGGRAVLDKLGGGAGTAASVPVAVLGALGKLDTRLQAFRHGAVAVVPRTASVDAIATRVAALVKEVQDRTGQAEELGEATFDELVELVSRELKSGILSVQGKDGEATRIVLGAGRPVADAVEEFVRRLRPLVSKAEPLSYEIHSPTGGAVGFLDAEPGVETDPALLEGLRVLLVDTDPARADAIAQELRARKVVVAVADASGRGLERARGLDPEVVILDAAGIEGPGFEVVRAIRRDVRLRWASMLVAPWDDIWPTPESTPDVGRLAERIAPLVENDRALRLRVANETSFDARLESTGPCRFLRILATASSPVHATFRSRAAVVEVDLAEGLVVGAQGSLGAGDVLESVRAISALLAMGAARVHVERRANPTVANLMAPVEEALSRAAEEVAPIPISPPPPKGESNASPPAARRRPFPAASELRAQGGAPQEGTEPDSVVGLPRGVATHAENPPADARDLRWNDTDEPGLEPPSRVSLAKSAFMTAAPGALSRPAFASKARAAFGVPAGESEESAAPTSPGTAPAADAHPHPTTPASHGARQPAPRKATLAMGGPLPAGIARGLPTPAPVTHARAVPVSRSPTKTMGSVPPDAAPADIPAPALHAAAVPKPAPRLAPKHTLLGVAASLTRSSVPPPPSAPVQAPKPGPLPALDIDPGRVTPELAPGVGSELPAAAQVAVDDGLASLLEPGGDGQDGDTALDVLPHPAPATDHDHLLDSLPDHPPPVAASTAFAAPPAIVERAVEPGAAPAALAVSAAPVVPAPPPPAPAPPLAASPPASSRGRSSARTLAWMLMGVGLSAVLAVGGVLAWMRFGGGSIDSLLALVGLRPGGGEGVVELPVADAGVALVVAAPPLDAGGTVLPGALADAGVAVVDAGVAVADAGTSPALDAGADAGVDAGAPAVEPPPEGEPAPGIPPPVDGETAESLVERAEASAPPIAEALYRRALELDPRYHHAMIGLAELLVETGRPAEAIPFIEDAISRRRTRAAYRVLLGDARRAAGDAAGATRAWREALELEPDNRQARDRLGE